MSMNQKAFSRKKETHPTQRRLLEQDNDIDATKEKRIEHQDYKPITGPLSEEERREASQAVAAKMAIPTSNESVLDCQAKITLDTVTSMTASELNKMSSEERSSLFEDVHGVRDLSPEEKFPSVLEEKLHQMDVALHAIPNKPAFDEAQRLCSGRPDGMVNATKFRVKFLRAERYNVKQAAARMVNHLSIVHQAFGPIGLVRYIHLSDMMLDRGNQGTDTFLFSGNFFQVMPFRDRVGRRIVVRSGRQVFESDKVDAETRLKAFLYICQQLSDDIECQIKGVVLIGFPLEQTSETPAVDEHVCWMLRNIAHRIAPVRISAVHICVKDNPWFRLASSLLMKAFPSDFRVRTRVHVGSIEECCYKLMAYGIPSEQIPITSSGVIKCADHKKFIAFCQEREDAIYRNRQDFRGIFCPSSKDIIVGRGPRIKSHIGNEIYRAMLQSRYELYNKAGITEKKKIAFDIIRQVHDYGGRFLVPSTNGWVETDDETARSKVSIAFRDIRKVMNAKKNQKYTYSVAGISVREVHDPSFECL